MNREIKFQDLARLHRSIRSELNAAFDDVLESSAFIQGKYVRKFEEDFSKFVGIPRCFGVANGTDALEIALKAIGISSGDSVLVPAMTFAATAEAVLNVGAVPVFVDISPDTLCATERHFEEALGSTNAKAKAFISVPLHGLADRLPELADFAKTHRLEWIEDCAQAHGALVQGRHVGGFGAAGTFSFYPGKNLGALGDAGAIVTNSGHIAERVVSLRDHGRTEKYLHTSVGRNSRLDGLQAAFLSVKLKYLSEWTLKRRTLAQRYFENLEKAEQPLRLLARPKDEQNHVFHNFVVRIVDDSNPQTNKWRARVIELLGKSGIETGIHYPVALSEQPAFKQFRRKTEQAERVSREVLSLPIDPLMSLDDVDYVSEVLIEAVRNL